MRVELGAPEDLAEVLTLERRTEGAPHWAEATYQELLGEEGTELRRWRVVVVRDAVGAVVGFAVGTAVRAAGVAELESVVVGEEARRLGVGRAMCEAVATWAGECGAEALELEVWEGNVGAVRMYEAMGFVEVGRRQGYYGAGRDARLMRLELAPRAGRNDPQERSRPL